MLSQQADLSSVGVGLYGLSRHFAASLNLVAIGVPAQAIDATQALNRWAGVSKPKVLRGRSLSWRTTLLR